MSKRNAERRGRPAAPVKKPFPLVPVLGVVALVAVLAGVLVFAARNTGTGATGTLAAADRIDGIVKTSGQARNHVTTAVTYPGATSLAPDGGDHNALPQTCAVYTAAVANEHAVHSLEHGAVWVTYDPARASKGDVELLANLVNGNPYRLMSPYPGLTSAISLQAWGRRLSVDSASDSRVKEFLDAYTYGPQKQEEGASCEGTSDTGPLKTATSQPPVVAPTP